MLWHAIAPSRGYTKAANELVRHQRLSSDAKILLIYVQGLPAEKRDQALSEHAKKLGITGRSYQKAKELLVTCGFLHQWRQQGEGGLWKTEQVVSNVSLSGDEAVGVRDGGAVESAGSAVSPTVRKPTVGEPSARRVGGYTPVDEEREKNTPHPPTETPDGPEAAEAERVLLSLRHSHRSLHLGVAEARKLVGLAVDWLRRGVSGAEMRRVLVSDLPSEGVRSAVGFLRHRLVVKMPGMPEEAGGAVVPEPVAELVACVGPGDEHVFRAVGGETHCGPCRREAAWTLHQRKWAADADGEDDPYRHIPWRERFAALGT